MSELDDLLTRCTCCTGRSQVVPVDLSQRPGLSALAYRIGSHSQFKQTMLAALAGDTPLGELGTRRDDDLTIGLLDSWATVLDVLTFYQERIANENYLRTALADRSLHELARLVGYQPRPGVAAQVPLAFTLDDGPTALEAVRLPVGTRAQSVPVADELPQSFETSQELLARPEWNRLTPRGTRAQTLTVDTPAVWIEGVSSGLAADDLMLLVINGTPYPRKLTGIHKDTKNDRTLLTLQVAWPDPQQDGSTQAFGITTINAPARLAAAEGPAPAATRQDDLLAVAEGGASGAGARREMVARLRQGRFNRRQLRQALAGRRQAKTIEPGTVAEPSHPFSASRLGAAPSIGGESLGKTFATMGMTSPAAAPPEEGSGETALYVLRVKTAPFGHNAPGYRTIPQEWRTFGPYLEQPPTGTISSNWDPGVGIAETVYNGRQALSEIRLAQEFSQISPDSWVTLHTAGSCETYRVAAASEKSLVDFGLSGRATHLELLNNDGGAASYSHLNSQFQIRNTTIYAASEQLSLAEQPIMTISQGTTQLELKEIVFDLEAGRPLILCGERRDLPGVIEHEELVLTSVDTPGDYSILTFAPALEHSYLSESVEIYANVVVATHGASHQEVLGSGDASAAFQRFELRQAPLTHVSAPVPSGGESTLELRVGGVRWQEASGFYSLGPEDPAYVLERDQDGTTRVLFGDGQRGARLPTGNENVTASYRVGIGSDGLVGEDTISLLATRHLGVREVINPIAASGAEDPESREQVRRNAPLTVLTFERVVSLQDFEDFTRAFAGVGKARANWVWDGSRRIVHLTVAGSDGGPLSTTVRANLITALAEVAAPFQRVRVDDHDLLLFGITAQIRLETGHRSSEVLPAAKAALVEAFSFEARNFGQRVAVSEVLATLQATPGVAAAKLNPLSFAGSAGGNQPDEIGLPARPARFESATILPAQLLLVMAEDIHLEA